MAPSFGLINLFDNYFKCNCGKLIKTRYYPNHPHTTTSTTNISHIRHNTKVYDCLLLKKCITLDEHSAAILKMHL